MLYAVLYPRRRPAGLAVVSLYMYIYIYMYYNYYYYS